MYTSSELVISISCPSGSVILVESVHYNPATDCKADDYLKVRKGKDLVAKDETAQRLVF